MTSRSWVARSIATPVSWIRVGSGPTRVAWARKTLPRRPSATSSRSFATAGLKRSTWPTISLRSASSAAPRIRSASGSVVAIGFSTSTCRPAASASSATSACVLGRAGDRDRVELVGAARSCSRQSAYSSDAGAAERRGARASSSGSATATSCGAVDLRVVADVEARPCGRSR